MKDKIAVFYTIGQINDWWEEEFYTKQLTRLQNSTFYENIDFIDINVVGDYLPLPFILNKTRNIAYGKSHENNSLNWHEHIYNFCLNNLDYKILQFHSLGVSYDQDDEYKENKINFRNYLETINIDKGNYCIELLNHYDLVGTDLVQKAVFYNGIDALSEGAEEKAIKFHAPHFQGGFWWSTSKHIFNLNLDYLIQEVPYKRYLPELWLGSNNPKIYNFYSSNQNHYYEKVDPPYDFILEKTKEHLNKLLIS
jgi:hypothetical protein